MTTYNISRLICECGKEFENVWHDDEVILIVFERHALEEHLEQKMQPTMVLTKAN